MAGAVTNTLTFPTAPPLPISTHAGKATCVWPNSTKRHTHGSPLELPLKEVLLFFNERQTGLPVPYPLRPALTVGLIPRAATAIDDHEVTNQCSTGASSPVHNGSSRCQPSLPGCNRGTSMILEMPGSSRNTLCF